MGGDGVPGVVYACVCMPVMCLACVCVCVRARVHASVCVKQFGEVFVIWKVHTCECTDGDVYDSYKSCCNGKDDDHSDTKQLILQLVMITEQLCVCTDSTHVAGKAVEACQLLQKKEKSKLEEYVKNMSPAFLSSIVRQLVSLLPEGTD